MGTIAEFLEDALGRPVIDETGLGGFFEVDLKWKMSEAELIRRQLDARVLQALENYPDTNALHALPPELRSGEAGRRLETALTELKKPAHQRFKPEPAAVITAVRERLGLELISRKEEVQTLVVGRIALGP